jgi:nucleotide-binding universal stress UspA family protein
MPRDIRSKTRLESTVPFRHVLVPTDLTERTERALTIVEAMKLPEASQITLLHVIETIDGVRTGELKAFFARLERKARAAMTALARGARKANLRIAVAVAYGRRAEEIVAFAAANGVDLIVLPSHRVNPSLANRDWGTISYQVGILAQCPVLLVK